jgi:hypothetical protein
MRIAAIPLARQTRNKRQNHKNGKTTTKDKRELEDNMRRVKHRPAYDGSCSLCTADKGQATADS